MLFKACAEGEYELGKTYCGRDVSPVYANALNCITSKKIRLTASLVEVRIEGVIGPYVVGEVVAKEITAVRILTPEEKRAVWTGRFVCESGTQLWHGNGQLHREGDLPAVIYANGGHAWYQNGQVHREGDLPAFIDGKGYQAWYRHGKRHREGEEDPPAVIYPDGRQEWYLNDKHIKSK